MNSIVYMKGIWIVFVVAMLLGNKCFGQATAKINVKITNMNMMSLERYSFFKSDDEVKVDNLGGGRFLVNYYGKKPKLFMLNFRHVLISPGDSINLEFKVLDDDPDHHRDTLIASGKNKDNYMLSNLINSRSIEPKKKFPDVEQPKYQENIRLLYAELEQNRKVVYDDVVAKIDSYNCDKDLIAYSLRNIRRQLLYDLVLLEESVKNAGQKKVLNKLADSVFSSNQIVKADTAYAYFMEIGFKNYFNFVAKRYGNLKTEKDMLDIVGFIEEFPDDFVRDYFVYFLATDYRDAVARYKTAKVSNLISINPYIGRTRNKMLDKSKFYPIN